MSVCLKAKKRKESEEIAGVQRSGRRVDSHVDTRRSLDVRHELLTIEDDRSQQRIARLEMQLPFLLGDCCNETPFAECVDDVRLVPPSRDDRTSHVIGRLVPSPQHLARSCRRSSLLPKSKTRP